MLVYPLKVHQPKEKGYFRIFEGLSSDYLRASKCQESENVTALSLVGEWLLGDAGPPLGWESSPLG